MILWEDPPPDNRGGGTNHKWVAAQLKSKPGTWARVASYRTSQVTSATAQQVRRGDMGAYPAGEFEACARTVNGEHYLYVRYVGEE